MERITALKKKALFFSIGVIFGFSEAAIASLEQVRGRDLGPRSGRQFVNSFPEDCPNCRSFHRNNRSQCRSYKKNRRSIDPQVLKSHLQSLKSSHFSGTRFTVNPDIALCMWQKESSFKMNAANCKSSARGVGQVLVGTAREALRQRPCRGTNVTWSNSAKSSKKQVFLSMCTLYMKSRGRPVSHRTLQRYYGSRSPRRNRAYANSIMRCARKQAWNRGAKKKKRRVARAY